MGESVSIDSGIYNVQRMNRTVILSDLLHQSLLLHDDSNLLSTLLHRNMFPLLLSLGRRLPVVGDIIAAFDGKSDSKKGDNRERPRPVRRDGGRPPQKRYDPEF